MIDTILGAESLRQEELEAITDEVSKTLSDLYDAREALTKKMIGKKSYQKAAAMIDLVTSPEDIPGSEDEIDKLILDLLGKDMKQTLHDEMLELLQSEPEDETDKERKSEVIRLANLLFRGEEIVYLLDKPDKLSLIGVIMEEETNMMDLLHSDEDVTRLYEARHFVDNFIADLYGEATNLPAKTFEIEVSDMHFRITLDMNQKILEDIIASDMTNLEKEAKIAALTDYKNISTTDNFLQINRQPVSNRNQAQEVASILHCVPDITKRLRQTKKIFPKKQRDL